MCQDQFAGCTDVYHKDGIFCILESRSQDAAHCICAYKACNIRNNQQLRIGAVREIRYPCHLSCLYDNKCKGRTCPIAHFHA